MGNTVAPFLPSGDREWAQMVANGHVIVNVNIYIIVRKRRRCENGAENIGTEMAKCALKYPGFSVGFTPGNGVEKYRN